MKILKIVLLSLAISSCALIQTQEHTEDISEKTCRKTCQMKNKTYQGFDEDIGCFCGIKYE